MSDELSETGVFNDGKVLVVDIKEFRFLLRLVKTTTGCGTKWGLVTDGGWVGLITFVLGLEIGMEMDCDREADGAVNVLLRIFR